MNKRLLFFISASLIALTTEAQQDPIYAQYLNNPMIINPAYAGSNNMFNAGIQYRTQWAGLDGNPTTANFSSHMSVFQNKVGLGIQVIQDKIGDSKNTEFNTLYSYKLQLSNATLSFGMQAGLIRYTNDPTGLSLRDPNDPVFTTSLSESKINFGAGLLLKNDRYMIGLSVPRLLPSTVSQGGQEIQVYKQNFYLFGSYIIFLSENVRFKPSVLLRGTQASPISADLNASINFKEYYTAGLFTRNFKTYGLLAQVFVKGLRFGYVFELPGSSESSLNFTSHEVTLGISLGLLSNHDKVLKTF
ncbi:MAG: type IX secretion system membrane protein PorP/SprF [Cyclobacteriaceae bacterium]|nr:type IX secretion system membrane protein PorP/SprF [Cyclobacteriaceae bacterium]